MKLVGIQAKEGISINILQEASQEKVSFPQEPICEEDVVNSTVRSERDRKIRNEQLKNIWLKNCPKIDAVGIL